jgi:hypothetical protein
MKADLKLKRAHAEDALRASEARYRRTRTANANRVLAPQFPYRERRG